MSAIYLLIPLTLILLGLAVWLLFWAINNDQYGDLEKSANEILFDELAIKADPIDKSIGGRPPVDTASGERSRSDD